MIADVIASIGAWGLVLSAAAGVVLLVATTPTTEDEVSGWVVRDGELIEAEGLLS